MRKVATLQIKIYLKLNVATNYYLNIPNTLVKDVSSAEKISSLIFCTRVKVQINQPLQNLLKKKRHYALV